MRAATSRLVPSPNSSLFGCILLLISTFAACAQSSTTVLGWGENNANQIYAPAGLSNAVAVAGGGTHSLCLRADGTVVAWGFNLSGQANVPAGLGNVVAIAAGSTYSLALTASGSVAAWGGIVAPPPTATNVVAIAGGFDHALALRGDGTVVSWGSVTNVPDGLTNVIGIAAGRSNSLALLFNGTVVAWGDNSFGKATPPANLNGVISIAAGYDHCLALRTNGVVVAWGSNSSGQTNVPADATNIVEIACGGYHSLALRPDGTYTAWGDNTYNQSLLSPALNSLTCIAGGGFHTLAIRANGAPAVTIPPASQTIILGQPVALNVKATGQQPIFYQWQKNGARISGATRSTFALSSVVATDAAAYNVVVSNAVGTATSATAVLTTVGVPPWILTQPRSMTNLCGSNATLRVVAAGPPVLHFQWQFQGNPLAGATNSTLSLPAIQGDQGGDYNVVISNPFGSITSSVAAVTVIVTPIITADPSGVTNYCGRGATFDVVAGGPQPLSYQWLFNGSPLQDATNASLSLTNLTGAQAGIYSAEISCPCGSVTSAPALLDVLLTPTVTSPPQDATIYCGNPAAFKVSASGPTPILYQWLFNGRPMIGATNTTLVVNDVMQPQAGFYSCVAACPCGAITSAVAQLNVVLVPLVTEQPTNTSVICGETANFFASAAGPTPITYQWQFQGAPIAGATDTNLVVANASDLLAGAYTLVATCPCGSITSAPALLSVLPSSLVITSSLTNSTAQGQLFTYQITGTHSPTAFTATRLPPGLALDPTNGIISGTNLESGLFGVYITAANVCASDTEFLLLDVAPGNPVITSPTLAVGIEGQTFTYTITADNSPTRFGVKDLPLGLTLDTTSGVISGQPTYGGEYDATISAYNLWGGASTNLHFSITNGPISALSIAGVTTNYSAPYLLDFQFSLRDSSDPNGGNAISVDPSQLTVTCFEDANNMYSPGSPTATPISTSETAFTVQRGNSKQIKTFLALDFSASIIVPTWTNILTDPPAVDNIVQGAQLFVDQQPANEQIGIYECHRDDQLPTQVQALTTDKTLLDTKIAGVWTNNVKGFPGASLCWDTLVTAIKALGSPNADEQHYLVFVSDGNDQSSTNRLADVIAAALKAQVRVYCVGFGTPVNTNGLMSITSATAGRFYYATSLGDLAANFASIGKDVNGQYILRWATLKRGSRPFLPSFRVSYQGTNADSPTNPIISISGYTTNYDTNTPPQVIDVTTNYATNFVIAPYTPSTYAGNVLAGALRFAPNADIHPTGVDLRATYVPRYIRQIRLHYRANWPCTPILQSTDPGNILAGWTITNTPDGTNGTWSLLSSPNPQNLNSSIPFGAFGPLVTFAFRDVLPTTSNAFSFFQVDTNIYTNTGNQTFVISNLTSFVASYPALPHGTPVPWLIYYGMNLNFTNAELSDLDHDGIPAWMEYQAGTDPTNAASKFIVRNLKPSPDQIRYQFSFPTALNRTYRVSASPDLINWDVLQDNVQGTGSDVIIVDTRLILTPQMFYRVLVY